MWATEGVINTIELSSAQIEEERRTDIVYGWNNDIPTPPAGAIPWTQPKTGEPVRL